MRTTTDCATAPAPTSAPPAPVPWWRPRGLLGGATAAAGLALAVQVGLDGSPAWQVVRVLAAVGLTAGLLALQAKAHRRLAGAATAAVGIVAVAVGVGLLPHVAKVGLSMTSAVAVVELAAGLVLTIGGTRRLVAGLALAWRVGGTVAAVVATALVATVVAPAVLATNVPPTDVGASPADVGLTATDVTVTTADGVPLAGWYVPPVDGAAVVVRHGAGSTRSDVLAQAAVLADHGYGVLLLDARGHGGSGGRAMDFGWYGDEDVAAGVAFLAARPEVDPGRIGAVGLSMGGEEVVGAAAAEPRLRAVVAEGATARRAEDEAWLSEAHGWRGALQERLEWAQDQVTDVLTDADPPTPLRRAVEGAPGAAFLLVAAGDVAEEADAAAHVAGVAPDRVEVWVVPGAGHTDGLATDPTGWEDRVIGFLDAHLR